MTFSAIKCPEENLDLMLTGVLWEKGVRELVTGGDAVAKRRHSTLHVPALRTSARGGRVLLTVDENGDAKVLPGNARPAAHLELTVNRGALGRLVHTARERGILLSRRARRGGSRGRGSLGPLCVLVEVRRPQPHGDDRQGRKREEDEEPAAERRNSPGPRKRPDQRDTAAER